MSTEVCSSWMPHRSGLIAADKRGDVRFVGSRVRSKRFWSGSPKKGKMHISRAVAMPIAGLQIDRKMHLIHSWRRQQEEEARQAEAEVTCPVDCVREVYNCAEFEKVLLEAEAKNDLVVVDFYNSSCGACKYILPQFVKLCKRGCTEEECDAEAQRGVVFVKHNVRDDYDDVTDLARFYSIRHVPMFSFFMDGCRVDQFPTRDRARLEQSISRLLSRSLP